MAERAFWLTFLIIAVAEILLFGIAGGVHGLHECKEAQVLCP